MKKRGRKSKEELIYKAHEEKAKHLVDLKLRERGMLIHYIFQSLLATFSLFLVLLILQLATPVIVAALGATAFVVFAMPKNVMAQPRNVIGGHLVGVISGGVCAIIFLSFGNNSDFLHIIAASASVGLAIFVMVVTDTEHPPGCSTALGLVVHALGPLDVGLYGAFILISATIIATVKHALDPRLKDLV
jgi:CBS-domain-containing membrane protein